MARENASEFKPYKGTESYQVEDATIFFGRKADADQIIAKVLSSWMALLHAQSGAGKTSLLNALVIPQLEKRGWTPVRILPHTDPITSTRYATLNYVVPPPETEANSLKRLMDGLSESGEEPTLGELLDRYDKLPIRDPRKRGLVAPIEPESSKDGYRGFAAEKVTPYVCRLVRSSLDMETFAQHLAAVAQGSEAKPKERAQIAETTAARTLLADLSSEDFISAYRSLMSYLDPPSRSLRPFFENLVLVYGRRRSHFGLALIYDQFEELFTRFVDPGTLTRPQPFDIPDWHLRYEFIEELAAVSRENAAAHETPEAEAASSTKRRLPIRCLISMRSEYIAQLGPFRSFAPEIDESFFHLDLLTVEGAGTAIREPAKLYGYGYSENCYQSILGDLTKEERFIEPAHLSLVCEKLWEEKGRSLSSSTADVDEVSTLPTVHLATYKEDLKGAKGILGAFFQDYLKSLEDPDSRVESLDLLEPLITGSGTRNIVEYNQLVKAPLRDEDLRKRLLHKMVDRTILRVETRLGNQFVEITHEFLIPPIQEALRELVNYPLRSSLRSLLAARQIDAGSRSDVGFLLKEAEFRSLHDNRHKIPWDEPATELMFRAAIYYGSNRDAVRVWSENYAARELPAELPVLLERIEHGGPERSMLSAAELRLLNERRASLDLSETQQVFIFRSSLLKETADGTDNVRYWTRRLLG